MKRYSLSSLLTLAVLLFLIASCIREDNSDCPPEKVRVYFSYRTTYSPSVIDPTVIERIDLFVFDRTGNYLGQWTDYEAQLSPSYYMELPLAYGDYRIVCWAGLHELSYTLNHDQTIPFEESLLALQRTEQQTVEHIPTHLFHAMEAQAMVDQPDCQFSLELRQLTNSIDVTTEGLETSGKTYRLSIRDTNGDYQFDASPAADCGVLDYIQTCAKDDDSQPYACLRVMALSEQRATPVLRLTDTTDDKVLFEANLIELILKLRDQGVTVDFENIHEYQIHLRFNTEMDVEVSINGWDLNNTETEL
ncbi:hypothetical protein GGR06_002505 [Bacteroides reticulotermitis]|uniref:FimB/Mfa2 family fimbrial subunit n=1 Tax=Bacteroides reticulotermitis TaxID=1133319 RepID=A0A840CX81_9BACE|nr:FimB/Mfa2 family fimbrial subunit [Bacteroides reticulotermitis]MBB4044707.1 hypothetical protein [Bacteroides reticulotermitis]